MKLKVLKDLILSMIKEGVDTEEIDIAIFMAMEEYVEQEKQHILSADVLKVEDLMRKYKMYGYYSQIGSRCIVYIDTKMTQYVHAIQTNDKAFEECVDTMIHEHRHVYQYAYEEDVIYDTTADKNSNSYDYSKDATEIDARKCAKKLLPDAYQFIYDYLILNING